MSDILLKVNREKNLPNERYDEKLFKQAYKAGLEAKEMEKKNRKKKIFLRVSLVIISIIICSLSVILLLSMRKERVEYIESIALPESASLETFDEEVVVDEMYLDISPTNLSAQSALVFDPNSGGVIFEKDIKIKRPIASITKLLAVLVALESYDLEEMVDVDTANMPEDLDWTLGLQVGDRIKVDYLLKTMLISSYNDAAYILANAYPNGGYKGFVGEMNRKAQALKMADSMFDNPAGIDSEKNYSTAYDVGLLVSASLNRKYIMDNVSKGAVNISWYVGEELKSETIYSTNQLYGVNKYIKGLKTGITDLAGQCFVGYFVYSNGSELITVVLGSEDRFTDTQNLEKLSRGLLER